jgi:hypothetical protein
MEIQAQNSSIEHPGPLRPRSHFTLRFFKFHFIRLRPPTQCKKQELTNVLRKINRKKNWPSEGLRHEASMFHQRNGRLGIFINKLRNINGTLQDRTDSGTELRTTEKFMDISILADKATIMSRNLRHKTIISFMKSPKVEVINGHNLILKIHCRSHDKVTINLGLI